MPDYFDNREFDRRVAEYRRAPTDALFQELAADFLYPLCRTYLRSFPTGLGHDDFDDVLQIAVVRCLYALDRYHVGSNNGLNFFSKVTQNIHRDWKTKKKRYDQRHVSLDNPLQDATDAHPA